MRKITLWMALFIWTIFSFSPQTFLLPHGTKLNEDSIRYANTTSLDFSYSALKQLPSDIGNYINLEQLNVSNTKISELNTELLKLKKLKCIKMNNLDSLEVEASIAVLKQLPLEELEMDNAYLMAIPMELVNAPRLKKLSIKGNNIHELPADFCLLSAVKELDLSYNKIDTIPEEIRYFYSLEKLNLSYNPCINYDFNYTRIASLNSLKDLSIDACSSLPSALVLPDSMVRLSLNNATFKQLPISVKALQLKTLQLNNCNQLNWATAFTTLSQLPQLKDLSLGAYNLQHLPDEIALLKPLQELTITNSGLRTVTPKLSELKQLKIMHCNVNDSTALDQLFQSLANSDSLRHLDLSSSFIQNLPESIGKLKQLETVKMQQNNLFQLPESFYQLNKLKEIDLRDNKLNEECRRKLVQKFGAGRVYFDNIMEIPGNNEIQISQAPELYEIDAGIGGQISTQAGTKINVPANAFVDKNGKVVKGIVQLSYKDFYDPAGIFASKINMNYDSAGITTGFESAGMFELKALKNNKDLMLSQGKKIKVDFVSINPKTSYNYYRYDSVTTKWTYKGNDKINKEKTNQVKSNPQKADSAITNLTYPVYPRMSHFLNYPKYMLVCNIKEKDIKRNKFTIKQSFTYHGLNNKKDHRISQKEIDLFDKNNKWVFNSPDNKAFMNMVLRGNKFFNPINKQNFLLRPDVYEASSKHELNLHVEIIPDKAKDCFDIVFTKGLDSLIIPAYLDISYQNPRKTQKQYKKLYEQYKLAKQHSEARNKLEMAEYQAAKADFDKLIAQVRQAYKLSLSEQRKQVENERVSKKNISRTLMLDGMGVWNCDRIPGFEQKETFYAYYTDESNKRVHPKNIMVVDVSKNGYITYTTTKISIDKKSSYLMVLTLKGDNIAVAHYEGTEINPINDQFIFEVKTYSTKKMTVKELREKVFKF